MCKFASFIVERGGTVHWYAGIDNHHEILSRAGIDDSRSEFAPRHWAKVEVVPPNQDRTRPVSEWSFQIDEVTTPDWFEADHRRATLAALAQRLKAETGVYCVEYADGDKVWYLNGKRHREDGPAVEWTDGTKKWYLNGQLHREDGPAIERANGDKEWYLNGQLHREDGPAVEYADGYKAWYLDGQRQPDVS